MKVSIGDLRFEPAEKKALIRLINGNHKVTEGNYTTKFEGSMAKHIGLNHCSALNSGTSALLASLLAIKQSGLCKKNSEYVITSPLTYPATINAIIFSGFKPLFVDIEDNLCISADKCNELLSGNYGIAGIVPVHLLGFMPDMQKLSGLAKSHGIFMIEDCAESFGSRQGKKQCGTFGDGSIFSFFASHTVGVGELGCFLTNNDSLHRAVNEIKDNGRKSAKGKERYDFAFESKGLNFKTIEFMSLIGHYKIKNTKSVVKKRYENVKFLNNAFSEFSDYFILPELSKKISYFGYPLVICEPKIKRRSLFDNLYKKRIEARSLFGCLPTQQKAFSEFEQQYRGRLPNAEYAGKNGFYLPCHQYLAEEDLHYLASEFKKIVLQKFK